MVKKALFGILKVIVQQFTDNLSSEGIPKLPINNLLSKTIYFASLFSERELKFMFAICHRPSVCLSVVCRL